MNLSLSGLISFVGILVQCSSTLVTVLFFWLLGRYTVRRPYFYTWTRAWLALLVALLALVVRYTIIPTFDTTELDRHASATVLTLYFFYQYGKLLFGALLVLGTLRFIGRVPGIWTQVLGAAALGVFAAFTVISAQTLDSVVAWQAGLLAPAFTVTAALLLRLDHTQRTLGTRLVGFFFGVLAVTWVLYFFAFNNVSLAGRGVDDPWSVFTINNSFIDSLLAMLLSMGMVVMLMESATRETEEIRAARLRDLASSEARLSSVIRSASDAIVTVDVEGRINLFNPAAENVFGVSAAEALGRPLASLVKADQRDRLQALMQHTSPGVAGQVLRHPLTGVRAGGEEFPLELAVTEFVLAGNLSRTCIIRDLTEVRRAEAERDELQRRLAHAQRMETVGQLVSGVAHELNNPLAAVLSFAEILLQEQRVEHDMLALTTIREQARRCRTIVRNLQTYVREGPLNLQPVVLREVLDRVARAFEPDFAQFGIRLTLDLPDSLPLLEADPEGLEQVLTNLVSNAVHAIGTFGEIRIHAADHGERIHIVVEDTGPGIGPDVLPRLFEPFFSSKRTGRGTGLGLSVCQGIVELHGGTIEAANREAPAVGARILIRLPVHARPVAGQPHQAPAATRSPAAPVTGAQRVLVIEDEVALRGAMRRYFEKQGWRVDEAETGWDGLNRLLQAGTDVRYDLVLSDLKMPGMTGIELHDRLAETRPDLLERFVFITGDVASPEAARFITSTRQPVLVKPFELATLAAAISTLPRPR